MSVPPILPLLDHLSHRPFSFYPPILNIEHNEWLLRRGTWSEVLVVNRKTGLELWIPRRFLGEVSRELHGEAPVGAAFLGPRRISATLWAAAVIGC